MHLLVLCGMPGMAGINRDASASSNLKMGVTSIGEKGSDTKNAKHPSGRSGFWCLTPFRHQPLK